MGFGTDLREHQFEFISTLQDKFGTSLRTHTDPVDPWRRRPGAICLNGDFESCAMQRFRQGDVELE